MYDAHVEPNAVRLIVAGSSPEPPINLRIVSVDLFRGLVMCLMLMVDVCGDTVPFFAHSGWEGLNLADFVMPGFIFLTGLSVRISLRRSRIHESKGVIFRRGLQRALRLFILGIIIQGPWIPKMDGSKDNLGFNVETFRIMGILQRISICYLIVLSIVLFIQSFTWRCAVVCSCIVSQLLIQKFLCVPGCTECNDFSVSCNAESYMDRLILGTQHLYKPTSGYDPEGLISTMGCVFTCYLGYVIGDSGLTRLKARVYLLLALMVCGCFLYANGLPLNKALWTLSYNMITTGVVIGAWSLLDVFSPRDASNNPFIHLGMNGLLFYILSDCGGVVGAFVNSLWIERNEHRVTIVTWFLDDFLEVKDNPHRIIFYALVQLTLYLLLMSILYHKRVFIKI